MKLWREIVSTAIVGTGRQEFELSPSDNDELCRILTLLQSADREVSLLKSAAVIGGFLDCGIVAATDTQPLPEPAANEKAALIPKSAERFLAAILAGNYPPVLSEFFDLAANKVRILPPQVLPEILDAGSSKPNLRKFILPILGERGRWLARHKEDWQWALYEENTVEIWENGTHGERLFVLEMMRRQNPAAALELLMRDWHSEAAKDRAAFLEVLRINLDRSDEDAFDKIRQTDKSGDVRRVVVNLLFGITNSNLVKTLTERAFALVNFKHGGFLSKPKIEIDFPQNFENDEKGDVLNDMQLFLNQNDLGKKAIKIVKLLGSVPPKVWEERFSVKKETFIEAAVKSEWHKALLDGLRAGAVNFADEDWLISILKQTGQTDYYFLCNQIQRSWTNLQIEKLIVLLLEGKMKSEASLKFAVQLFYRLKGLWSGGFTLKILDFLQKSAGVKDLQTFNDLLYHTLNAGHLISAEHLIRFEETAFTQLFEKVIEVPGKAKLIEEFVAVIRFRREMHAAFESEE